MSGSRIGVVIVMAWPALLGAVPPSGRDHHAQAVAGSVLVDAGREGRGTGWIVDTKRRWVVTNYHLIGPSKTVDVLFPYWIDQRLVSDRDTVMAEFAKRKVAGRVLKRDVGRDLALIEVERLPDTARVLPLAEKSAPPGARVQLVGNRRDLDQLWAYTKGHIRQEFRSSEGYPWRTERLAKGCRLLAAQLPINEGDSGGALLNDQGEVVGVVAAILYPAERAAAAIDVTELRAFLGGEFAKVPAEPKPARELYDKLVRAAAWVQSPSATGRASGAVIDRARRLLLTTATAAGPHERLEVIFPLFAGGRPLAELPAYKAAERVRAAVLARDPRRNLALLEVESLSEDSATLELATEAVRPGDALHAVANPNGIDALWLYSALSVRQTGKVQFSINKEDGVAATLILQGPGSASDGGGPIVDAAGKLVAIAGGKDGSEQQVSYAVDLREIRSFLDESRPLWKPQTADEFHRRGRLHLRLRQLDAALADFNDTLRHNPGHGPTLIDRLTLYRLRGEPEKATAAIHTALKYLPPQECAVPIAHMAELSIDDGKLDAAMKDCDLALKKFPKSALLFAVRAEAWRRKKNLAKALIDVDEAAWLDPNLAQAYLTRGRIHLDRRDWERALTDLTRAIELDPYDPAPLRERARAFEEKTPPEPDKAKRDRAAAERLK